LSSAMSFRGKNTASPAFASAAKTQSSAQRRINEGTSTSI